MPNQAKRWENSSGVEFAATGRNRTYCPQFGSAYQTPGESLTVPPQCAIVVMTHTKRLDRAKQLVAALSEHHPALVCDTQSDIIKNSVQVMRKLCELAGALQKQNPAARTWGIVVEDDVILAENLSAKLLDVLATLPSGAGGFSLHASSWGPTSTFRGWMTRKRTEILRTQFAGWRAGLLPGLLERLETFNFTGRFRDGWDTCCTWALDDWKWRSCIHYPSLVQHSTDLSPSLLGHKVGKAPTFTPDVPGWINHAKTLHRAPERARP